MMWIEENDRFPFCQNCCKIRPKYILKISSKNNRRTSMSVVLCDDCFLTMRRILEEEI